MSPTASSKQPICPGAQVPVFLDFYGFFFYTFWCKGKGGGEGRGDKKGRFFSFFVLFCFMDTDAGNIRVT